VSAAAAGGVQLGRIVAMLSALASGQFLVRLGGLVLVPLFLHRWSPAQYGEWLALSAVAGYITLVDPAIHLAAVNVLTQCHARGDVAGFRRVQRAALGAYVGLAATGSAVMVVAAACLPITAWLRLGVSASDAALVISLLGAYVLWAMPARLVSGTYQALGSGARSQWVTNVQQTVSIVAVATVLLGGGGMVALATLQLTILTVVTAAVVIDLHRREPAYAPRLALPRLREVRELVKPSAFFSMLSVANLVSQQGSILLVSGAVGSAAVALFSVSRTLAMIPRQAIDALSWACWPEVARVDATRGAAGVRLLHKTLVAAAIAIPVAFAAGLWCEGPELIALWTRGRLIGDEALLRALLALAVLEAPWLASGLFTMAVNRHQAFATAYLAASVVGVALGWSLLGRLGVLALPIGLMAGQALCGYHFAVRATCRMLGELYAAFALRLWGSLGLLAAAGVLIAVGSHGVALPSPLRALMAATATAALAAPVIWWGWLTASDRARLMMRARFARQPSVAVSPPA